MHRRAWLIVVALGVGIAVASAGPTTADPPATGPGGPCIEEGQQVSLSSLPSYEEVARQLRTIEASSQGTVAVASAGLSGEGRELLYATVGTGPDVFWLQARIHGNELHSTEAALQILQYLGSGSAEAGRIRDALTVVVIPMYNPDGATANIRQSTTPNVIDLNRDWENFAQPESRAFFALWAQLQPRLALDLHHFGQASRVQGTDELNSFQIGARSIDPARMTAEQWLTNRQMAMISVDALRSLGTAGVARYPLIDITNAVLSRMLMGGVAPPGGTVPGFTTQGAIFYEVRSVGQKSNGMLEQLFLRPSMAVLNAAADGSLYDHPGTGWDALPFGQGVPCGGGPDF